MHLFCFILPDLVPLGERGWGHSGFSLDDVVAWHVRLSICVVKGCVYSPTNHQEIISGPLLCDRR